MIYLLDVNVLIALIDPLHIHHEAAHAWFQQEGSEAWATCPITENGVLRIVGSPRYSNSPGTPAAVASILGQFCSLPGHVFWADDLSLLHSERIDVERLLDSQQVTDSYLLALASFHEGRLATFDRSLVTSAVHEGAQYLHLIR